MIYYWLLRLGTVARFMPLRVAYWLAAVIAELFWLVWRSKRNASVANLTQVLGDTEAARTASRRSFRNYGRYLIDFVRAPKIRPEAIRDKVRFDQWEAVAAAVGEGRGVIFVLMHVGNWDMGGPALAARGYKVNVIAQTFEHDRLNELVVSARQVRGMKVIPAEHAAMGIVRALKRSEILGILIDRPMDEGVEVNFFGRPVTVPAGPAWIALRTGARVMPAALVRASVSEDVTHALVDLDVSVTPTGDMDQDIRTLTSRILESHERFIRAYPDQWFMFRPMWSPSHRPQRAGTEPALAAEG
ncbi:MAG: lysophospholipid acyltransferase family protein [Dehalococcoidia bacterium]